MLRLFKVLFTRPFFYTFTLAIALHVVALKLNLGSKEVPDAVNRFLQVERWTERRPSEERQVVQTSPSEEETDARARFWGERRNRTHKERRSPLSGRFSRGRGEDGDEGGFMDLMPFGTTPHALPSDIGAGSDTVLNTDPVLYASFLNRIADEVYDAWVQYARSAIRELPQKLESNVYITKLQIVIDDTGALRGIQTLKSCGVDELDDAPRKAFQDAKVFPNPPSQMFQMERMVRFTYEFHFHWSTSLFNIVPLT